MNRENYDKKVLSTFNIIGCYFVNHYYNALYHRSKKAHERYSRSSLTDEYKKQIEIFHDECSKSRSRYTEVIRNLHNYYQTNTKFRTILLQDFINNILSHFLPDEHYGVMNDQEKSHFLHRIIIGIIRDFTIFVSEIGTLQQVIDDHTNEANPEAWINKIMDIQIIIREKLWQDFVRKGKRQTVDLETYKCMQEDRDKLFYALQESVQETCKLKNDLANARRIVEHYSLENGRLAALLKQDVTPPPKQEEPATTPEPAPAATPKAPSRAATPKSGGRASRRTPPAPRKSPPKETDPFATPVGNDDSSEPSSSEDDSSSSSDTDRRRRGKRNPPKRQSAKPAAEKPLIDFGGDGAKEPEKPAWDINAMVDG